MMDYGDKITIEKNGDEVAVTFEDISTEGLVFYAFYNQPRGTQIKLVIAGSRSIKDYNVTRQAIIESGIWAKYGKSIHVISGEAEGPDKHGEEFAAKAGLKLTKKPADWGNIKAEGAVVRHNARGPYNAVAGHWRNQEMADVADACLIVWDGRSTGSLDMLHRMLAMEKPCYLYPLKISADLLESLEAKGCVILYPNSYTK